MVRQGSAHEEELFDGLMKIVCVALHDEMKKRKEKSSILLLNDIAMTYNIEDVIETMLNIQVCTSEYLCTVAWVIATYKLYIRYWSSFNWNK